MRCHPSTSTKSRILKGREIIAGGSIISDHVTIGDILMSVGEEILKSTEALLRSQGADNIETILPSGDPARVILDCAERTGSI